MNFTDLFIRRPVVATVVSLIILLLIKYTIGLRVSEADEAEGLDLALHGETFHD